VFPLRREAGEGPGRSPRRGACGRVRRVRRATAAASRASVRRAQGADFLGQLQLGSGDDFAAFVDEGEGNAVGIAEALERGVPFGARPGAEFAQQHVGHLLHPFTGRAGHQRFQAELRAQDRPENHRQEHQVQREPDQEPAEQWQAELHAASGLMSM